MFSRQQRTSAHARNQADGSKSAEGHGTAQMRWLCCQRDEDRSVPGSSTQKPGWTMGQTEQGPCRQPAFSTAGGRAG